MVPASPFRHLLSLGLLGLGAVLLYVTRPRLLSSGHSGEAPDASCLSNLSQISRAYALYARDFDGKIPLAVDPEDRFNDKLWTPEATGDTPFATYLKTAPFIHVVLRPYLASPQVFRCPADQGWSVSRIAQIDPRTGDSIGLQDVRPSSFVKYGTSYYSWTIYGFSLLRASDILHPEQKVILFDGDLCHQSGKQQGAGELFLDGHAAILSRAQHEAAAPDRGWAIDGLDH